MFKMFQKKLSLKVNPPANSDHLFSDSSTSSPLVITKPDLNVKKSRKSVNSAMLTDTNKPTQFPAPKSSSIISLKNIANMPLTEVTSLTPNEIPPDQVEKSENPSVNYFFERAYEASKNNEFQKAVTLYRKVLACEANHFETCINIGICMMQLNMHNEAINSFECAIKADKGSFIPYYNKALSFIAIQNYSAALMCMDTASLMFDNPPDELQKIRTFAIFKAGKVSSAISNNEGKESPTYNKVEYKTFSPIEEVVYEKPERILRRLTIQPEVLIHYQKLVESIPHRKFTIVEDFDSRNIKTSSGLNVAERSEYSSHSASPFKVPKHSQYSYNWKKHMPYEYFKPKKSIPIKISELESIAPASKDQLIQKKVREKLKTLEDKLIEYIAKKIQKCFLTPRNLSKYQLTEKEVEYLFQLFNNKEHNLQEIDQFCQSLEFFADLPREYREKVYLAGKVEKFEKGIKLFVQGNVASKFFLLMKGKVVSAVDSEKAEVNSTTEYLRYARSITSDKRYYVSLENLANCTAEEVTYTLTIPTSEYQLIFCDLLKQNIEDRVCFLINLPLFKGIDPNFIIPLAWHLNAEKYLEGEVIQKKYELPKGLTIIYSGYCGIYTTGHQNRSVIGSEYANIKKRKPKPVSFYVGNLKTPVKPVSSTYSTTPGQSVGNKRLSNTEYKTFEKIEHGLLRYGDYFGGRVLLEQKYNELTSKYSIIAESKVVEVFVITKQSMQNLQEKLVTHLKTVIQKGHDIDCPPDIDAEIMDYQFNDWQKYKKEVIDDIQRKKFVDAKKIEFPYLR